MLYVVLLIVRRSAGKIQPLSVATRSLKVIGTDTDRSATCDFLIVIHSNYWPISCHFQGKRRIRSKFANFYYAVHLTHTLRVPWNFAKAVDSKSRVMWCRMFDDLFRRNVTD